MNRNYIFNNAETEKTKTIVARLFCITAGRIKTETAGGTYKTKTGRASSETRATRIINTRRQIEIKSCYDNIVRLSTTKYVSRRRRVRHIQLRTMLLFGGENAYFFSPCPRVTAALSVSCGRVRIIFVNIVLHQMKTFDVGAVFFVSRSAYPTPLFLFFTIIIEVRNPPAVRKAVISEANARSTRPDHSSARRLHTCCSGSGRDVVTRFR